MQTVPLNATTPEDGWQVYLQSFAVGGGEIHGRLARVGSGSPFILLPTSEYVPFMRTMLTKATNGKCFAVDVTDANSPYICSTNTTLPNVHITLGERSNVRLTMTSGTYMDDNGRLGFKGTSDTYMTLGIPFLRTAYTVFDGPGRRIRVAPAHQPGDDAAEQEATFWNSVWKSWESLWRLGSFTICTRVVVKVAADLRMASALTQWEVIRLRLRGVERWAR